MLLTRTVAMRTVAAISTVFALVFCTTSSLAYADDAGTSDANTDTSTPASVGDDFKTFTARPLEADNSALASVGIKRGRGMERQSLGIALAQGAVLEARVTNQVQGVTLNLVASDSTRDVSQTLPPNGTWTELTASAASALFVHQDTWSVAPTIEYRVSSGTSWEMPTFTRDDDQSEVVEQLNETESPFAVIEDPAIVILLPQIDFDYVMSLGTETSKSTFDDVTAVIDFYDDLITHYDQWLGLDNSTQGLNANAPQTYFIRPDTTGTGAAYYDVGRYVGVSARSGSIAEMLSSDSAWMVLHELAHGYDGIMTSPATPNDMDLLETWNNIYSYLYQTSVRGKTDNNWLYGNGKAQGQKLRDDARHAAGELVFADLQFSQRLDVMVRILDLTTANGFARFNQNLRAYQASDDFTQWPKRSDLIAALWGAPAGYNLMAWLDQHSVDVTPSVAENLYDVQQLPLVLPVSDFFTDYQDGEDAAETLNLDSPGDLVTTTQLAALNEKNTLTLNVSNIEGLSGEKATLWDGSQKVAEESFDGTTVTFTDVPMGVYTLRLPADPETGVIPASQWVKVTDQAEGTVATVDYQTSAPVPVGTSSITLKGLGDVVFAALTYDPQAGTVTLEDTLAQPHSLFPEQTYAKITVTQDGQSLLDRTFIGDADRDGQDKQKTVHVSVGTQIQVKHLESSRLSVVDVNTGDVLEHLSGNGTDTNGFVTTYFVTDWGLVRGSDDSAYAQKEYVESLEDEAERLQASSQDSPNAQLASAASRLIAAIDQLPEGAEKTALNDEFGAMLDALVSDEPGLEPSASTTPSASQTPTPSASQTPTPSASQAPTPSASQAPTPSASQAPTPSASQAPTPSNSATASASPSVEVSLSPEASETPEPTQTSTPSNTPSGSATPVESENTVPSESAVPLESRATQSAGANQEEDQSATNTASTDHTTVDVQKEGERAEPVNNGKAGIAQTGSTVAGVVALMAVLGTVGVALVKRSRQLS